MITTRMRIRDSQPVANAAILILVKLLILMATGFLILVIIGFLILMGVLTLDRTWIGSRKLRSI